MKYKLPKLQFSHSDVVSLFSKKQLDCHYHGHHQSYIDKVNKEIEHNAALYKKSLIDLMRGQVRSNEKLANSAAQAWNHAFFWRCIGPAHQPVSPLFDSLCSNRGSSVDKIKEQFVYEGLELFGSGYIWLVLCRDSTLKVVSSKNAENPLLHDHDCLPLLTVDLWEHAYYLDFQMNRPEFLKIFWNHINWTWVGDLLSDRANLAQIEDSMAVSSGDWASKLNKNSFNYDLKF